MSQSALEGGPLRADSKYSAFKRSRCKDQSRPVPAVTPAQALGQLLKAKGHCRLLVAL